MTRLEEMIEQLEEEAPSARKMLERIPDDKLDWKPHEKSMTFGQLGGLVADMFGWFEFMIGKEELDFAKDYSYPHEMKSAELVKFLDRRLQDSLTIMKQLDDKVLAKDWTMRRGEQIFMQTTRGQVSRQTLCHLAHHRGQLSVYLRLNDIPVPSMYGPTADEGFM